MNDNKDNNLLNLLPENEVFCPLFYCYLVTWHKHRSLSFHLFLLLTSQDILKERIASF